MSVIPLFRSSPEAEKAFGEAFPESPSLVSWLIREYERIGGFTGAEAALARTLRENFLEGKDPPAVTGGDVDRLAVRLDDAHSCEVLSDHLESILGIPFRKSRFIFKSELRFNHFVASDEAIDDEKLESFLRLYSATCAMLVGCGAGPHRMDGLPHSRGHISPPE